MILLSSFLLSWWHDNQITLPKRPYKTDGGSQIGYFVVELWKNPADDIEGFILFITTVLEIYLQIKYYLRKLI